MEGQLVEVSGVGSQANQSSTSEKDFVVCPNNGSDIASIRSLDEKSDNSLDFGLVGRINKSAHSSISSFSEVHGLDLEPKLGKIDHGDDVPTLMAEAQLDVDFLSHVNQRYDNEEGIENVAMVDLHSNRWMIEVKGPRETRKDSEFEDIDPSEVQVQFDDESDASDEVTNNSVGKLASEENAKDACVFYHGITYLGSACVNAPASELELKRTISIMRDNANVSIDVILGVGLTSEGSVKLIDPESRANIASYDAKKIIFWGKADDDNKEKDCVAFNVPHGEDSFQCHVFKCTEEDTAVKIIQSFSNILRKNRMETQSLNGVLREGRLDPNNLTFKFDVTIDIQEQDSKGTLAQVARDKNCFKLRENLPKRVILTLEQHTNKTLHIERCFGLLLAPGRNVDVQKMHLLDQVQMESKNNGREHIICGTWYPNWPDLKVLNAVSPKGTRVFISVAADLVFSDLKEPVRVVKESKVKIFTTNEKFWNPSKPRLHEEYIMDLKENFLESGERYYELDRLVTASSLRRTSHPKSTENFMLTKKSTKKGSFIAESSIDNDDEPVEIMGPDEEDDEPLLSGSGEVSKVWSEEEVSGWADVLLKWKDQQTRPSQLVQLVRKGVPDPMRGQIWQMLADVDHDPEILNNYSILVTKDSPHEQVILWDVTRTFPAHEIFREADGQGRESLHRICKAYSVYDEDTGYCQGLSYVVAVLLLHMPEEQAFCLFVKILTDYGHRDLFMNSFDKLHQRFYTLERLMEDNIPSLHRHFEDIGIEAHMYASQWFITLFTSKFPLPLVYSILDLIFCEGCDVSYQIALALLKEAKRDLVMLDFESVLKYFRVSMPKRYLDEAQCERLFNVAFSMKVSKKRLKKYEKEYSLMKEEMELQDPAECLRRDNEKLMNENMRLQQENDTLAHEIVTTKVGTQERITELEDRVNQLLIDNERMTNHLKEADEEVERLKSEEVKVKELWRKSVEHADIERTKQNRIIKDYKKVCSDLEERNEKFKDGLEKELLKIKSKVSECPECSKFLGSQQHSSNGGSSVGKEGDADLQLFVKLKDDDKERITILENELISAKMNLAEAKERADHLELKLHAASTASAEKSWFKKITNQSKK